MNVNECQLINKLLIINNNEQFIDISLSFHFNLVIISSM